MRRCLLPALFLCFSAAAQERYTNLNAAYNCLREPKDRLHHLLQLELGALPKDVQRIPSELMDLSLEIGQKCREADAFLAEKAKATSPLLQVKFFERGQEFSDKLQAMRQRVNALNDQLIEGLKLVGSAWQSAEERAALLQKLEELYRLLSYFARWNAQLQERAVRLKYLLEELDMGRLAKSKAYQLSGGEKRRLEITRALVTSPKLLLLDEPFSGIDPIAVYEVQKIVRRLKERGLGILITDHNVRETLKLVDRAYLIHKGEVVYEGAAEQLVNDPKAREIYLGPDFNL